MKQHAHRFTTLLTGPAWKKVGGTPHHGINVPLSSIWTEKSCGIGEFYDLIPLIDWCHHLGMDIIQLLPLNESGKDPSPYNALSSCALHPIYLSLHALPHLKKHPNLEKKLRLFAPLRQTKRVSYHQVLSLKLSFFKEYYDFFASDLKGEKEYDAFLLHHRDWLTHYALFKVLKDRYDQTHWNTWPDKERNITKTHMKSLAQSHHQEMEFFFMLQFLCFCQLKKVRAHAEKKGVFLKGDVPILVSPDSSDVWAHRPFFDFSFVAGSPPTSFDPEGQSWGFPLYNWRAMEQNHYEWWKNRLLVANELYHIYRIDHIIGFFRLWVIPHGEPPSKGHYSPSDPSIMRAQGRELLDHFIHFTDMLPIGEDLGCVPPFVKECLEEYGICGTKIFRWERDWEKEGAFISTSSYSPMSLTSVSTHDLDTVRLWWEKNPQEGRAYAAFKEWTYTQTLSLDHHLEILKEMHHSASLFHINLLQEYLVLRPELTWEDPEEERINYPGTIQECNWTYRYKKGLEVLTTDSKLQEYFRHILPQRTL